MQAVLDGIRVLDVTRFFSGPQTTLFLAGLGAEVIHVNRPGEPNPTAASPPYVGARGVGFARQTEEDVGINYLKRFRGKKSVEIDLKHPDGLAVFLALAGKADVLVENFSVGVTERLGIDYDSLRAINPSLVYCSVTGFGSTGPDARLKGFDVTTQAASGLMSITGQPGDPPLKAGSPLGDSIGGTFAMAGVLAALLQRVRSGEGQFVDVSMVDCLFSLLFDENLDVYDQLGLTFQQGNRLRRFAPFNTFQTRDGWVVVGVATAGQWRGLAEAMERPELADDAQWSDASWRASHLEAVEALVSDWTRTLDTDTVIARLRACDAVAGPIRDINALKAWPHLRARRMIEDLVHPQAGPLPGIAAPGFPLKLSGAKTGYAFPAVPVGTHNREIFRDLLGMPADICVRLAEAGAIGALSEPPSDAPSPSPGPRPPG